MCENGVRNRFLLSGTVSELMQLLVHEPTRDDDWEAEDRTSWKPEMPFMAGSISIVLDPCEAYLVKREAFRVARFEFLVSGFKLTASL